jgi:hypothetical protein
MFHYIAFEVQEYLEKEAMTGRMRNKVCEKICGAFDRAMLRMTTNITHSTQYF